LRSTEAIARAAPLRPPTDPLRPRHRGGRPATRRGRRRGPRLPRRRSARPAASPPRPPPALRGRVHRRPPRPRPEPVPSPVRVWLACSPRLLLRFPGEGRSILFRRLLILLVIGHWATGSTVVSERAAPRR